MQYKDHVYAQYSLTIARELTRRKYCYRNTPNPNTTLPSLPVGSKASTYLLYSHPPNLPQDFCFPGIVSSHYLCILYILIPIPTNPLSLSLLSRPFTLIPLNLLACKDIQQAVKGKMERERVECVLSNNLLG